MKTFFLIAILVASSPAVYATKLQPDFFEIKIYHLKNNVQVEQVDQYLKNVYIPALHRSGIKNIGVFKPIANDTAAVKFIYVLISFKSRSAWTSLDRNLSKDPVFTSSGKSFREAPSDKPPYERLETILLEAFSGQPHLMLPPGKDAERIYELRSYESPTENLSQKKMAMFNTGGEIEIFNRLGFNPVFYGKVVSGSRMPNFMYMPVFKNLEQHNAQWKRFGQDTVWKDISTRPENENKVAVSHIDSILMHAAEYSDF